MTPRQHALALLEFVRTQSNKAINDIPENRLTFQPSPTDNHALWVMGHLAATDAWVAGVLGVAGVNVPESIQKAFGMGSKPGPTGNPPAAEVRRAFDQSRAAIVAWLTSAPDAALETDLTEKTGGFASDAIDVMHKLAWHEGWHMGQVANVRKALGLPALFG